MDIAFLVLYKNDFAAAKKHSDTNAVFIDPNSYIQQRTDETFYQKTNSLVDINFVGGIKAELVDCCNVVQRDISDNFYYDGYIKDGIYQIDFEFGKIGKDFWHKSLYLKITDLVNLNEFYSNSFLVTNDKSSLSTRAEYTSTSRLAGVGYDLMPAYQTVRFSSLYHKDNPNKKNGSDYTDMDGELVSLRSTITYIHRYIFDKFDLGINDRIDQLFRHPAVFLNGRRHTIVEFKAEPIAGDTNFKTGEILVNPKEEFFNVGNQLFVDFDLIDLTPSGQYSVSTFPSDITLQFNKDSVLMTGNVKIFDAGNNLILIFTEADITFGSGVYTIDNSAFVTSLGAYYFTISKGLFKSVGGEDFEVADRTKRTFEILDGFYDETYYDTQYYL